MKYKPKFLTIVLILLALFLILQTWNYYGDKEKTWTECEGLSEKIVVVNPDNTEIWEGWQKWNECNQEYINQFMMFEIMGIFSVITIAMIILSRKLDGLKDKTK